MNNVNKILWHEATGSVYWMDGEDLMFAPMSNDNSANLEDGGVVDVWDSDELKEEIEDQLSDSRFKRQK